MAIRIAELIEYGELINLRNYSTLGTLKLKGREAPIRLELTGNPGPDLLGWHISFEPRPPEERTWWEDEPDESLAGVLQGMQIGVTGTMTAAEKVKVTQCPPTELYMRCKAGEPPPFEWKPRLYLEWYSQNGRVVIDMADPVIDRIEFVDLGAPPIDKTQPPDDETEADTSEGPGIMIVRRTDDGDAEVWEGSAREYMEEREADDPYGLFSDDLKAQLESESREADEAAMTDEEKADREMKLWDNVHEQGDGDRLIDFLQSAKMYPPPDQCSDEEAEGGLMGMLTELALYGIALHVCEHYTPRDAYRLLVEELLPNHRAHPGLRGSGWTTNFMTSEFCKECDAEADRKYEEFKRKHPELHGEPPPEGGIAEEPAP